MKRFDRLCLECEFTWFSSFSARLRWEKIAAISRRGIRSKFRNFLSRVSSREYRGGFRFLNHRGARLLYSSMDPLCVRRFPFLLVDAAR